MYPSTDKDGDISFASINVQPMMLSCLYNYDNDPNLSKSHYCPPSSSSFQILSPHYITLEDETILSDLLHHENLFFDDDHSHHDTNIVVHDQYFTDNGIQASLQSAMEKCSKNDEKFVTKDGDGDNDGFNVHVEPKKSSRRRRTSNKDRHSKINTARGPRDRRMRLSIDVAKKFFKLQDMLGFDKASKTVEWLLMKSKSCIQELFPQKMNLRSSFIAVSNSASSTSNCESLSANIGNQETPKFQEKSSFSSKI